MSSHSAPNINAVQRTAITGLACATGSAGSRARNAAKTTMPTNAATTWPLLTIQNPSAPQRGM